ncbi:MAG: hypothetical protein ACOX2G_05670 [Bacillota bacterium]
MYSCYPDGTVVSYTYDELDRQIQVQEEEDITTISYDARGNRFYEPVDLYLLSP